MNTTTSLKEQLFQQEASVFRQIPGMDKLHNGQPETALQYPDAAFALMISQNMHIGDREQNEIHQRAYISILRGESIPIVRIKTL